MLYDYDAVFNMLKTKGEQYEMDLPPLFNLDFIDHGALTEQKRNVEAQIKIFLDFLSTSDLFDILVPAKTKGREGYKVNVNDPRLPPNIKAAATMSTETFNTTTKGQKSARLRFLSCSRLSLNLARELEEKVFQANQRYDLWLEKATDKIVRERKLLGKCFVASILGSGTQR